MHPTRKASQFLFLLVSGGQYRPSEQRQSEVWLYVSVQQKLWTLFNAIPLAGSVFCIAVYADIYIYMSLNFLIIFSNYFITDKSIDVFQELKGLKRHS